MSSDASNGPTTIQREQARQAQATLHKEAALIAVPVGSQPLERATVGEAIKSIKPDDFLKVHQIPCGREGILTGIGGGATVGGVRYITGGAVPKAANWAVGGFILAGIVSYEYCQYQRRVEKANMARVVEVVTKKQADVKKKEDEIRRQRKQQQEEAARIAAQKSWYKFW